MKIEIEPHELRNLAEKVAELLKPYVSQKADRQEDTILDLSGLCEYLHVTKKWVHERTHLKEIPYYKLSNKQLRFRKKDIDKWLDSMKMSAINPLPLKIKLLK